jgi:hypothetical protein
MQLHVIFHNLFNATAGIFLYVHVIACKYWMMGRILSRSILYTREVSPL